MVDLPNDAIMEVDETSKFLESVLEKDMDGVESFQHHDEEDTTRSSHQPPFAIPESERVSENGNENNRVHSSIAVAGAQTSHDEQDGDGAFNQAPPTSYQVPQPQSRPWTSQISGSQAKNQALDEEASYTEHGLAHTEKQHVTQASTSITPDTEANDEQCQHEQVTSVGPTQMVATAQDGGEPFRTEVPTSYQAPAPRPHLEMREAEDPVLDNQTHPTEHDPASTERQDHVGQERIITTTGSEDNEHRQYRNVTPVDSGLRALPAPTGNGSPRFQTDTSSRPSARQCSISKKQRDRGVTLLTAIDTKNILDATESDTETTPTSAHSSTKLGRSATSSTRSLRTCNTNKSKLVYDLKYHPMDDIIQPKRATNRRLAHDETILLSDDSSDNFSVQADSDVESTASGQEDIDIEQKGEGRRRRKSTGKGKKRSRSPWHTSEPTRRSSRKVSAPKMSYNTDIHPQDAELAMISSDSDKSDSGDEDSPVPVSAPKRVKTSGVSTLPIEISDSEEDSDDNIEVDEEPTITVQEDRATFNATEFEGYSNPLLAPDENTHTDEEQSMVRKPVTESHILTPPPTIRVAGAPSHSGQGLEACQLAHEEHLVQENRDACPLTGGSAFEIYSDHIQDQVAADAKTPLPLNFDDDDQENKIIDTDELEEPTHLPDSMQMTLASHRERISGELQASQRLSVMEIFYSDHEHHPSPYGLGGLGTTMDGSYDSGSGAVGSMRGSQHVVKGGR